ncbi:HTH-type transcriptional regulator GbpR [Pelagimonas phthalicica]|uniref:HTH-type transcriptional regulator GbpR n=1 Tax=Pelagimonas phthalicica TaxID=1037362 RepID=A0A238JFN1_9RHOB|nr:LysR family transcriptional regulator [Pelagimonas phthalicica]TDS92139.1 DNA-binding transcriptional LysR family regulator [Pelagimonas phthalicica]SMX29193.1 HTH-type transcriptional regulator GbpR [Pelagimonas phthalicica]
MKLQYIETIVAIAKAGSIRAAAQQLNKAQPTLTKALSLAEEELGVQLFRRTARGVVPTEEAEALLNRFVAIQSDLERLDEEVDQLRGGQAGSVNVCVSPLAAVKVMPRAISMFRRSFPFVQVKLSSGLFPNALKPISDGSVDIVLGPKPPEAMCRNLVVEPLMDLPIVVITAADSPLRNAKSLAELTDCEWIMIGTLGGPGDIFRQPFLDNHLTPPKSVTTSESYFGAMSLVAELGAVCTFPKRLMSSVQGGWDVVQIPIQEEFQSQHFCLVTRAGHPLTTAAQHMENCIRKTVIAIEKAEIE